MGVCPSSAIAGIGKFQELRDPEDEECSCVVM